MELKVLRNLTYGIYIVTSATDEKKNGQIANTVFQVSSDPPLIAVCINKNNYTHELIRKSNKFCVSVISEDAPMEFIGKFGFRSGRNFNKFEGTKYTTGTLGLPVVQDYSICFIEAEVNSNQEVKTHTIFIGRILNTGIIGEGKPMSYSFYHGVKRGKSPSTAPTYIKD